jgi:hypothetical protein
MQLVLSIYRSVIIVQLAAYRVCPAGTRSREQKAGQFYDYLWAILLQVTKNLMKFHRIDMGAAAILLALT